MRATTVTSHKTFVDASSWLVRSVLYFKSQGTPGIPGDLHNGDSLSGSYINDDSVNVFGSLDYLAIHKITFMLNSSVFKPA